MKFYEQIFSYNFSKNRSFKFYLGNMKYIVSYQPRLWSFMSNFFLIFQKVDLLSFIWVTVSTDDAGASKLFDDVFIDVGRS